MTGVLERVQRKVYDLAVRAGLMKYRRLWLLAPSDWDREYASGVLDFYGSLREQGRYGVLTGFIRAFPRKPRILDIGCGVGVLRARTPDDAVESYVGIDPSTVAIEQAERQGFSRSRFHVGERPTPDMGKFDLIVLNEMMCYVEDLDDLLEVLKGYLAEDGQMLTSMFKHPGDVALHRTLERHFCELEALTIDRQLPPKNSWRVACYMTKQHAAVIKTERERRLERNLQLADAGAASEAG